MIIGLAKRPDAGLRTLALPWSLVPEGYAKLHHPQRYRETKNSEVACLLTPIIISFAHREGIKTSRCLWEEINGGILDGAHPNDDVSFMA